MQGGRLRRLACLRHSWRFAACPSLGRWPRPEKKAGRLGLQRASASLARWQNDGGFVLCTSTNTTSASARLNTIRFQTGVHLRPRHPRPNKLLVLVRVFAHARALRAEAGCRCGRTSAPARHNPLPAPVRRPVTRKVDIPDGRFVEDLHSGVDARRLWRWRPDAVANRPEARPQNEARMPLTAEPCSSRSSGRTARRCYG